jgi:superfamily II DNA/RNA helicase
MAHPPQGFSLRTLQHLVLDEADRILSLDFEEDIDKILKVRALRAPAQRALLLSPSVLT